MSKYSQKQIKEEQGENNAVEHFVSAKSGEFFHGWVSTAKVNKFEGMAKNAKIIEPVIIPGYKIRG